VTNILVVDDEEDIRLLTRLILVPAGYVVIEATGGREALARLDEGPVDLMILDIRMSGMDGWAVMRALDERAEGGKPRVLAFSAHVESEVLATALDLGCAGVLVKPFTREECLAAVRGALAWTPSPRAGTG
jgi:CheY-like chemotaxis protein